MIYDLANHQLPLTSTGSSVNTPELQNVVKIKSVPGIAVEDSRHLCLGKMTFFLAKSKLIFVSLIKTGS